MAQFSTVTDLRDFLATLLSAELGTFGNGIARIWIKPPDPPAGTSQGLECIIQRTPTGELNNSSSSQRYFGRVFTISLINFADDVKFNDAVDKIKMSGRLTFFNGRNTRYRPSTVNSFEQIDFFIFDPVMINAT